MSQEEEDRAVFERFQFSARVERVGLARVAAAELATVLQVLKEEPGDATGEEKAANRQIVLDTLERLRVEAQRRADDETVRHVVPYYQNWTEKQRRALREQRWPAQEEDRG